MSNTLSLHDALPILIVAAGMPLAEHWEIYLPVLILSVAGLALIMRLSKGWVLRYPLMLNVALLMLAFGGFWYLPETLPWVMVSLLVFFVGFNYIEANLPALVSTIAPAGKKGSAMGLFASFQFFGAFLGGVLSGWFGEQFGAESVYLLAMLMCLAWLWLLSGLNGSKRLKRYTLSLNQQHQDVQGLAQQLAALPGVADVTVIIEEDAVYLKVEDDQFNLQKARQIAGLQQ